MSEQAWALVVFDKASWCCSHDGLVVCDWCLTSLYLRTGNNNNNKQTTTMEKENGKYDDEIEELFGLLRAAGYTPQMANDDIPYYGNVVQAGTPVACDDPFIENDAYMLPQGVINAHLMFSLDVKGDSMINFGIEDGDRVTVLAKMEPFNGDVILASLDGEYTLKAYLEDSDGNKWLVPYNEKYSPILLTEEKRFQCLGIVTQVTKQRVRTDHRDLEKTVSRYRQSLTTKKSPTIKQQENVIVDIAPMVTEGRKWYSVYRAMVDAGCDMVMKGDFVGFCNLVARLVPSHRRLPKAQEMQRMCVKSFARPVRLWDENDAPVGHTRFIEYKKLAQKTGDMLTAA